MCGISGRFNLDGRPVAGSEIVAMRDAMVHRGPDGQGLFVDGPVGLGHRRLAIIDLAGGHQPLGNEDGTVTIVFNGEIYNFAEIRRELQARGHTFATRSDTEVIVHLYEEQGAACVERLRGMFAFAIWDSRRRQLLVARDRLGVKPLYYVETPGSLLFASEIKSLLQAAGVTAEPDLQGLRRYLTYRHPYGNATLFKGIKQLPPGHVLVANAAGTTIRRYWDVPERSPSSASADGPDEFLALLDEAVKLRMISDVPLGAFLSGGIDSSAVTALMARHTDRVKTFSIGFVPGEENELGWARRVADHCGADHHEFMLGSEDFFSLMQRLVWHHDEPMMFPASIPLYLLSRESKSTATVMLAGEGADEILAGYDGNVRAYWMNRFAAPVPAAVRQLMARLPLPGRLGAVAARIAGDDTQLIAGTYRLGGHDALGRACRLDLPSAGDDDQALVDEVGLSTRQGSFLDKLLYFQLKTYLVSLLMKQDKMSMAASIETRVPYLDHHLVALAFSLPDHQKVNGRRGKYLLKQACRGLLPQEVIDRPKRGFPVPIARWFREQRNPFVEVLLDGETLRDGFLDPAFVRGRVERFLAGDPISLELWGMLNLELWRREFLTGASRARAIAS
jgi:asparagine synthase (glutamine-hydrolysing)